MTMNKTSRKLNNMNEQEVFDTVAKHLMQQNEKSLMPDSIRDCAYRSVQDNGTVLCCAAGCLIEEDDYSNTLEGRAWDDLVDTEYVTDTHMRLIRALQEIHDWQDPHRWHGSLRNLAIDFKLNTKVLDGQ